MQLTMTEKIFAAHAKEKSARAGEIVTVRPDVVMLNDISGPLAFDPFRAVGCVIAASFARIFYRNAINIGLPLITCPDFAQDAENGRSAQDRHGIGSDRLSESHLSGGRACPMRFASLSTPAA